MSGGQEVPFFFARGTARLFALLHEPPGAARTLGFVLSHPFAEEKLWSHRVFVSLARTLAARGHPVLRFDYLGAGDSDGRTGDTSVETHLADLAGAVDTLAARHRGLERIGLVGLRLGATFAARLAERAAEGEAHAALRDAPVVLWDPVLDGAAYMQEVLRASLSAQLATHGKVLETREVMSQRILDGGSVNIDGYEIQRPLFESLSAPGLLSPGSKRHAGPVLVASVLPPGKPPKAQPALEALAATYAKGTLRSVEEHQFWREIKQFYGRAPQLEAATLEWLGGSMAEARAITFRNADGRTLFGTLHVPETRRPGLPTVVLFSPGAKMRVGPGRLYVPLTEQLNALGYLVLRYDFYGLGDSEGELDEQFLVDLYSNIQVGRYVADGQVALEWLRREQGASRFIVGGLCGGALTGLLVAEREPSVEALLSIGMTVTLDSDSAVPSKYITRHELLQLRQGYLVKMFDPHAWLRLLTFRSDFGVIVRSMLAGFTRRKPVAVPDGADSGMSDELRAPTLPPEQLANVNPLFPAAWFAFLGRGGRALMVFSEKDRMLGDWREKFVDLYPGQVKRFAPQVVEHVVMGANHVLSERGWQEEMHTVARRWLGTLARP